MTKQIPQDARVAIIIPAYNEGKVVADVIRNIESRLKDINHQIIVVDDGSTDNTASEVQKTKAILIRHIQNTGAGGATATGIHYASQKGFAVAATIDADGQHAPDDLLAGVSELLSNRVDLLIGSRLINSDGMSTVKVIGNRGLSFITYVMFGVNVTDSQSGLRLFSSRAMKELRWKSNGFEFCSEMLWRAKQKHLKIAEFPIKAIYTDYSKSKGQNNWNAFNILKAMIRHRLTEFFNE
jgi:glycosyltransferase involved in cell wall biosynthesis